MATVVASTTGVVGRSERAEAFIELPSRLHNRYFFVRHGESVLDERGIFLTNPSFKYDATYGLTSVGREQMREAARVIVQKYDGAPSWVYTSNFQRSFQSALILREECGLLFSQLRTEFSGLLDPRKMGSLDFGSQSAWEDVWANDLEDPKSTPPPVPASLQPSASVESCFDIYRRAQEAFTRLEATYFGEDVILVSHADTLSVFCAALNGTELGRHHVDYPFALGEVRCVDLTRVSRDKGFSPTDLRGDYAPGDAASNYL
ncbi:Histidine phosphatase superfamily, clade-1 [Ostreococcus tauri]|uniref:Histidine phosphatase superfamily n=1 Tax=Ostreococcus tauri TaxID=70448 RepID=A0A090N4H7_OSTTA|nr:Histidine phosphatase superfamily, clade-1 [Ostreococcus tauri]OUS42993.1 histidine phosphatase superfamily [Ostreococcus tauri]CEF99888.1 Histidine phosphatase superfamily, clade-1 [Ostreococcus tauri]|eukprot:XP_022840093.1 Histidine phosphatase superfamily, clade-1 [Ostreococcus tauri]